MFQRVSIGFVAGAVLGVLIIAGLVITDTRVHDPGSAHAASGVPSEEAAQEFVEDWHRMRTGTWTVDSSFVRVATDGRTYRGEIHEAQRSPQRIRVAFGTTSLEQPGKLTVCAPDTKEAKGSCRSTDRTETYEQTVESDVQNVRTLVTGPGSLYGVAKTSRHCYLLQATATTNASSTWGQRSTFCFDEETGAVESSEIVRGDVTDTTTATSIKSQVADSEFQQAVV